MLSTSTKRRRKTAAIAAASHSDVNNVVVLRLTDLPIGLFQHVSSYLPTPTQALFSVAVQEQENISSIILSSNAWDTLDFGDIEKGLAAKLSDDDISAVLLRIDAITNLTTLKLTNCINISGIGLKPLRRSMIIEQIDLSLTGEHQRPVLMVEPKLSCDKVVPILVSITERREGRRYCALKHLQFPWTWRQVGSTKFLVFLNLYESFLRRRGDILSVSCLNCSTRLNGYGWLNVVETNKDKKFGTQNYTCYKCLKHYCGDCGVDGRNSIYFCGECHRRYCDECSPRSEYCGCCENNYCSDCMSMNDCCGILIGGNQCDEKCCSKCRCQTCSRTFCNKRPDCDGKRVRSCGRCNGIFCVDCGGFDACFNCATRFCKSDECSDFKQTCKICGVRSCSSCVDGEKDTKIQTCERCGTSYCWYCIVDDGDEHELIKDNDCIECVKMIALTLHRKVHDRTLIDWSTAVDVPDVLRPD